MDSAIFYPAGILASAITNSIARVWEAKTNPGREEYLQDRVYKNRLQEVAIGHQHRIAESLINSGLRMEEQQLVERLRSTYSVDSSVAIRKFSNAYDKNPFSDKENTQQQLEKLHISSQKPILLIAPFWEEMRTNEENEKGGFVTFRPALNNVYEMAPWRDVFLKKDGYIARPLYHTDRDIDFITSNLGDIPGMLIYGTVQGASGTVPYSQRINPSVVFWNLIPGQDHSYTKINVQPFLFQESSTDRLDIERKRDYTNHYSLEFQDSLAKYLTDLVGVLGSVYNLYKFSIRPRLKQFEEPNSTELELLALDMSEHYDRLCKMHPEKEDCYRLDQSIMLFECGLVEASNDKAKKSFSLLLQDHKLSESLEEIVHAILENAKTERVKGCLPKIKEWFEVTRTQEQLSLLEESIWREKMLQTNRPARILVCGKSNVGKSSLIKTLSDGIPRNDDAFRAEREVLSGLKKNHNDWQLMELTIPTSVSSEVLAPDSILISHADVIIFLVSKKPSKAESNYFDIVHEHSPNTEKIVFVNKWDVAEIGMNQTDREIISKRISASMGKYIDSSDNIFYGSALRYDPKRDELIQQKLINLETKILTTISTL